MREVNSRCKIFRESVELGRTFSKGGKRRPSGGPPGGPQRGKRKARTMKKEDVSPSGKAHNKRSPKTTPKEADVRHCIIRKEANKHYSIAQVKTVLNLYNENIERTKPLSHAELARRLNIPASSFSDIIRRAQIRIPSLYGNKKIQRYEADIDKVVDAELIARKRHGAANRVPESIFEALKTKMNPNGTVSLCTAIKKLEKDGITISCCTKTLYNRINSGVDCAGMDASWLPERGRRLRKKKDETKGHKAKNCPAGHSYLDMPEVLLDRKQTFGVWEMDTIHSCKGGTGALLTLTERQTRMSYAIKLPDLSQESVCKALRKLMKSKKLKKVVAILTDNGSEFLDFVAIEAIVKAKVYYTYAYSAWQKGSVERYNRQVRQFFPKGTDFGSVSAWRIAQVVAQINDSVRPVSLKGKTANEAFSAAA